MAGDAIIPALPPLLAAATSAVLLIVALTPTIVHWHRRRAAWRSAAETLGKPHQTALIDGPVLVVSLALGLIHVSLAGHWLFFLSQFVATCATCTVVHRRQSRWSDQVAGAMLAITAYTICVSLFGATPQGILAGIAIAAGFSLWLARFWRQQLLDGVAWTTTGRLIPTMRITAYAAIAIGVVEALLAAWTVSSTVGIVGAACWLILTLMLLRDWNGVRVNSLAAAVVSGAITIEMSYISAAQYLRGVGPFLVAVAVGIVMLVRGWLARSRSRSESVS
ncbi:MAG: hypothetical protein U1D55_14455 [Phycisphaerae bacterium]